MVIGKRKQIWPVELVLQTINGSAAMRKQTEVITWLWSWQLPLFGFVRQTIAAVTVRRCDLDTGANLIVWDPHIPVDKDLKFNYPLNYHYPPEHYNPSEADPSKHEAFPNAVLMLAHHLRRWPNIETALGEYLFFSELRLLAAATPREQIHILARTDALTICSEV